LSLLFFLLLFICPRHTQRLKPIKTHREKEEKKKKKTDTHQSEVLMLLLSS
jgi:hypothetical protein